MTSYQVRITAQARAQIAEIRDYIAEQLLAPDAAKDTLTLLASEMASLALMPLRVKRVEEEPWRAEGVRVKIVKNYLIYFWVDEAARIVQVIAVLYARRDQIGALVGMEG